MTDFTEVRLGAIKGTRSERKCCRQRVNNVAKHIAAMGCLVELV